MTATSPLRALVIRKVGFDRLMEQFPSVRLGILMAASRRTQHDRATAAD